MSRPGKVLDAIVPDGWDRVEIKVTTRWLPFVFQVAEMFAPGKVPDSIEVVEEGLGIGRTLRVIVKRRSGVVDLAFDLESLDNFGAARSLMSEQLRKAVELLGEERRLERPFGSGPAGAGATS